VTRLVGSQVVAASFLGGRGEFRANSRRTSRVVTWVEMMRAAAERRPLRHQIVEHLWSPGGAAGRNLPQTRTDRQTGKHLQTTASACHRSPSEAHGKEGVNSSNLLEGFRKGQQMAFFVALAAYVHRSTLPKPVPKICPRPFGNPAVLAPAKASGFIEHLLGREAHALTDVLLVPLRHRPERGSLDGLVPHSIQR
jgi:hypothetical protein